MNNDYNYNEIENIKKSIYIYIIKEKNNTL